MTFIGKHLPELVPFMEDTYTPQAVNQARNSFKRKIRKSSATFFYGAMCGFFTTDELDDLLFEASEVSRFLLEVEGTTLDIDDEIDIEDRITKVMRSVGEAAKTVLKARGEESKVDEKAYDTQCKTDLQDVGITNLTSTRSDESMRSAALHNDSDLSEIPTNNIKLMSTTGLREDHAEKDCQGSQISKRYPEGEPFP